MKFIKVQTDRETQQIQKVEPDKQTWRRPLWTTMMISLRCLKTVYFDILVMLGKHILILFDTNEAVILSSINHCLQSLKRNLKRRLCQLFYLFIFFFGGGGEGVEGMGDKVYYGRCANCRCWCLPLSYFLTPQGTLMAKVLRDEQIFSCTLIIIVEERGLH